MKELIEKLENRKADAVNNRDSGIQISLSELDTILTALKQSEWVKVEDGLPDKNVNLESPNNYIWCNVYGPEIGVLSRPYNIYHKCWDDEDMDDHFSEPIGELVTHWMPLPTPPTES